MILKNKKLLVLTSLLTLLPIPMGLLLWNYFPETMAIHWGISGQPDGYASVPFSVFVPPLSMLVGHWVCIFFTGLDKGNKDRNKKIQSIMLWTIPIICNLSCCGIYALALGLEFSPIGWTMVPMGILFAIIGNYMPKTKMNSTIGIKVVWAYSSEENWNATHRFAGKVWVIGGIVMALSGFFPYLWAMGMMFGGIAVLCILPVVYSWRFYRKELAEGKDVTIRRSQMDKKLLKLSAVFLVLLTVFIAWILFYGDITYDFQEDWLMVDSNMYTGYVIRYEEIQDVEYRKGNVDGLRVGGFGSFRLLMGFFQNEEFGTHIRYTYYEPESCIVVKTDRQTVVLSGETDEETLQIFSGLLDRTKDISVSITFPNA